MAGVAWAASGELSYSERVPEFDTGGAKGLAFSPDGENLYVAGGNRLTVLERDPASGEFSLVEVEKDGVDDPSDPGGPADGLGPTRDVVVSSDGNSVYTTAYQSDNAVGVYERDPATGKVSFVEVERDEVDDPDDAGGTVKGMFRPEAMAISADGGSVYVVTSSDKTVVVFERDKETGELSYLEMQPIGGRGADVAIAPDGAAVYAVSKYFEGSISVFDRDLKTGELSLVQTVEDGIDGVEGLVTPYGVAVSPDDDYVYAVSGIENSLVLFKRDTGTQELAFVESEANGQDDPGDPGGTVTGLEGASEIAVTADGTGIYVTGTSEDAVATFRLLPDTGEIDFVESDRNGVEPESGATPTGISSPGALAIAPGGEHLYVGGVGQPGLALFERHGALGQLGFLLTYPDFSLQHPRGLAISPDGEHLVATTLGDEALKSFARDPADGSLQLLDTEIDQVDDPSDAGPEATGLVEPTAVAFAANGTDVYVTDTNEHSISLFHLDPLSGELTYVETEFNEVDDPDDPGGEVHGLYEPWDIVVSPDGRGVFSLGNNEGSLAAFDRDPATGELSFVEYEQEGVDGVDGLYGALDVAISPDGETLYVTARSSDSLSVFSRDPATNELEFLELEEVESPEDVTVSADGGRVYVATYDGIARFERDPGSGLIDFAETVDSRDFEGAPEGSPAPIGALALAPEGGEIYASAAYNQGILYVHGLGAGGAIASLIDVERDRIDDPGDPGPTPAALTYVNNMEVSPDGRHLYLVSEDQDGIGIFEREEAPPPDEGSDERSDEDSDERSDDDSPGSGAGGSGTGASQPAPDRALLGARFGIPRAQLQAGRRVVVRLRLRAGEPARSVARGRIRFGRRAFALRPVRRFLPAGRARAIRLTTVRPGQGARVMRVLRRGGRLRGVLAGVIADAAGNRVVRRAPVVLAHRAAQRRRRR